MIVRPLLTAGMTFFLACSDGAQEDTGRAEQPIPYDSITATEMEKFALDPRRFPEMQGTAPLDSIDLTVARVRSFGPHYVLQVVITASEPAVRVHV